MQLKGTFTRNFYLHMIESFMKLFMIKKKNYVVTNFGPKSDLREY